MLNNCDSGELVGPEGYTTVGDTVGGTTAAGRGAGADKFGTNAAANERGIPGTTTGATGTV